MDFSHSCAIMQTCSHVLCQGHVWNVDILCMAWGALWGTAASLLTQKKRNSNAHSAFSSSIVQYVHPGTYLICCWVGDSHGFIQQHTVGCLTEICERWISSHKGTKWESSS